MRGGEGNEGSMKLRPNMSTYSNTPTQQRSCHVCNGLIVKMSSVSIEYALQSAEPKQEVPS